MCSNLIEEQFVPQKGNLLWRALKLVTMSEITDASENAWKDVSRCESQKGALKNISFMYGEKSELKN